MKILIIGGPRTGKTQLAKDISIGGYGAPLYHGDDIKHLPWSEQSSLIAENWMTLPGPWVIEGTAAVRALRKYVQASHQDMSDWEIIWIKEPKVDLTPGQKNMTAGVGTIWKEIEPVVIMRGAKVTYV